MKKILSVFLALLTLAVFCASCGTNGGSEESTAPTASATAEPTAAETDPPIPVLEVVTYNNEEFIILWPEQHPDGHFMHNEIAVEDTNGDFINDAVYKRNSTVETTYNIKIVSKLLWCSDISSAAKADNMAGDKSYGAFCSPIGMVTNIALEGVCADFNDMEYYSEEYPWWDHQLMNDYSIGGARFFGLGDIIVSDNFYPYSVFVNSDLYVNYQFTDDVFSLVNEGKWTVDKMMELGRSVPQSSDEKWDYTDTYGILINSSMAKALYYAFGRTVVAPDADGYPTLVMTAENTQPLLEKIIHVFHDDHIAYDTGDELGHNMPGLSHAQTAVKMFASSQSLFYAEELITAERLKNQSSDIPFWLLPMPKYDEDQKDYFCVLNDAVVVCVEANQDLKKCSLILSALGRESMETLTPAFYDVVLASRYMNDAQSSLMLSKILSCAKAPDIATLLKYGNLIPTLADRAQKGDSNFASVFKQQSKIADTMLAQLRKQIDAYNAKK